MRIGMLIEIYFGIGVALAIIGSIFCTVVASDFVVYQRKRQKSKKES